MAGRDEIVGFEKDGQVFPPDVREFFHESFHLPASFDESRTKIRLLGCPKTRKLNLDEEIALVNYLKMDPEEIDRLTVQSYPRLEMHYLYLGGKWASNQKQIMCPLQLEIPLFIYSRPNYETIWTKPFIDRN
ncbi:hypothetical protein OUZ56_003529 [Daphnia magna]|uniref:Uncharacterized protein n=1 Tax=Daphnia magna TaxID=35525 RepID=A0ABR0A8Z3_9CRUS|nr:hypothetical protein OUZ56_003529 [Daphnia magna]